MVLPEGLREISSYAFYGCKSLRKVNIPASVETLSSYAFQGCSSLTGIDLSTASSLLSIYYNCFYESGLTNIVIPTTVNTIYSQAFAYCPSLKTVVFESGSQLSQINAYAFSDCPALTYLFIQNTTPAEVSGSSSFSNISGRPTAYIPVGTLSAYENTAWGVSFDLKEKTYDYGVELSETSIKVFEMDGEHDRTISAIVFTPNGPLVNSDVVWASSAPTIASVSATGEVSYVGKGTATVTAKTTINGKEYTATCDVTAVDKSQTNGLLNVTAQNDRSGLLEAAGSDEALSNYVHLTLKGTINSYDIFVIRNRMPRLKELNLEEVSVVANPFEYYTNSHTEANRISDNAFRELKTLETVVLPKTIDYLGNDAFYGCSNLVSVKTFAGLNAIGDYAFYGCSSIKAIELQEGLLSIGGSAFSQCSNLEEINLPNSVYAIGSEAFYYCSSLKSVVLPKNLRAIERYSFSHCSNLESVIIPSNVNRIDYYAFYLCNNLKELRIPPMVENIGDRAFGGCNNIQDVYVYIANPRDIKIDMNTFSCWNTATLHIPNFSYNAYYWDTQWGQFHEKVEFEDKYDQFYTKSTLALNDETGTIDGTPDATFHAGGGLTVDEIAQDLNKVELKSDFNDGKGASLIASKDGKINVKSLDITIKVTSYKWHFFSFPFDIPLDAIKYEGESVWRRYDGAKRSRREGGWQDLTDNETKLEKGRGYIFQGTMDGELKITIENPDLSAKDETTGLFTHESSAPEDANWNFIGNPYTSYYNIDNTSLSAPITIWNGSSYEAYRPGDDDYEFYPFQAFFVQTPEGTSAVEFDADARDTYEQAQASETPAKAATRASNNFLQNRLFINLTVTAEGDSVYSDKTRIVFNEKQSSAYEASCDAAKFFGNASAIELFSIDAAGTQYAINERPEEDGCVDLGIAVHAEGMYTLEAVRMDVPVVLIDHVTKSVHDLSESGYVFSASAGNSKRFTIKISDNEATGIEEILNNSNTGLKINDTDKLYDLGGRKMNASDKGLMISNGAKVFNQ